MQRIFGFSATSGEFQFQFKVANVYDVKGLTVALSQVVFKEK